MLYFYVTIRDETPEVMVLDSNVIFTKVAFAGNP